MTRGWQLCGGGCGRGCGAVTTSPASSRTRRVDATPAQTPVERGQYIMNVLGACTFCHTPLLPERHARHRAAVRRRRLLRRYRQPDLPDNGNGIGCISTRNLTNDATGLKNATDEQIKNAFRNGIRTDGKKLAPIMPYWIFHNMTDEDADAIVAYLRTVPAVDHTVQRERAAVVSAINDGTHPQAPFIDRSADIPMPRGGANNASAMRGRYLSSHGRPVHRLPHARGGAELVRRSTSRTRRSTRRSRVPEGRARPARSDRTRRSIVTRNLTSDATGPRWAGRRDQIKDAIANGKDRDGNAVCAATHGSVDLAVRRARAGRTSTDIVEYIYEPAGDRQRHGRELRGRRSAT